MRKIFVASEKNISNQPVIDDADHGVAAGEERGHVGGLGARVEALVPGEDPVAEVLLVGVQEPRDGVGVQPRAEGTDVKLKQYNGCTVIVILTTSLTS